MFNFADATQKALAAGAAVEVADAHALIATVAALLEDAPRRGGDARCRARVSRRASRRRGPAVAWLAPRLDAAIAARGSGARAVSP